MLDNEYYNKNFLDTYIQGSPPLLKVQEEEMLVLSNLYKKVGLESLAGVTHLDIGTCTGRYLQWAYKHGAQNIYGIDSSPDLINFCKEYLQFSVNLILGSCADEKSYSKIKNIDSCTVMLGTISHLSELQLKEFLKILEIKMSPSGILVVSAWNRLPDDLNIYSEMPAHYLLKQSEALNYSHFEFNNFKIKHTEDTQYLTIKLFEKTNNSGV